MPEEYLVKSSIVVFPCAAADFGGVGSPVTGGSALPGDRDRNVDAEQAGQDGGGQVGGELEGGGAGLAGADSDLAEPLGADGPSGLAAGEQPWRGALVADGCGAAGQSCGVRPSLGGPDPVALPTGRRSRECWSWRRSGGAG